MLEDEQCCRGANRAGREREPGEQSSILNKGLRENLTMKVLLFRLFATPWITAHQASFSFTISQSLLKFMSIKLMMPSNHLILFLPLLLLPSILPSIRVF